MLRRLTVSFPPGLWHGRGDVRPGLLWCAAGLDWAGTWWGFALSDSAPILTWVLASVIPLMLAAGAIFWRRWFGWILFGKNAVGALFQIGSWGWRIGVLVLGVAGAFTAIHGMRRPGGEG